MSIKKWQTAVLTAAIAMLVSAGTLLAQAKVSKPAAKPQKPAVTKKATPKRTANKRTPKRKVPKRRYRRTPLKPFTDFTEAKDLQKFEIKSFFAPRDEFIDILMHKITANHMMTGFSAQIQIFDEKGKPAERCTFRTEGMPKKKTNTYRDGRIGFNVYPKNIKKLAVWIPKGYTVKRTKRTRLPMKTLSTPYRAKKLGDRLKKSSVPQLTITPFYKGLKFVRKGHICVYYIEKRDKKLAKKMIKEIEQIKKFCMDFGGLELKSTMDILLHHHRGPVLLDGIFAVPVEVDKNQKVAAHMAMWIQIHEATESAIIFKNKAYSSDRNLRFAGDGLAEIFSSYYCEKYYPAACKIRHSLSIGSLNRLIAKKYTYVNLGKDFPAIRGGGKKKKLTKEQTDQRRRGSTGYYASFYFWDKLRKNYGDKVFREVLAWFVTAKKPTAAKLVAKIKEITGVDYPLVIDLVELRDALKVIVKRQKAPDNIPPAFHACRISAG